ncbi:MAG TPA: hypothetical protein VD838_08100 [Anaeromyxobacteraceae bacterium]|nr:hypothetical protein [Anaeromyxobacteraceae bacterium]
MSSSTNVAITTPTGAAGGSPELTRLRTFQLGRLACALDARRAFVETRARDEGKQYGRESRLRARGLDHAAFGLYQACLALDVKEIADELVQRYRASPAPALSDLLSELRHSGRLVAEET